MGQYAGVLSGLKFAEAQVTMFVTDNETIEQLIAAAFLGTFGAQIIQHHGSQHLADICKKLHPRFARHTFAIRHPQKPFVHQRGRIQAGDAARCIQT